MSDSGDNVRPFVPVTDDGVPAMLREALDLAVAGKLRGVVLLIAYHNRWPMEHWAAGDLSVADTVLLLESWKLALLNRQAAEPRPPSGAQ